MKPPDGPLTVYRHFSPYLRIEDRLLGTLVPYQPNAFQRQIGSAIARQDRDGKPCRIIVLKSRRFGCSTAIQSRLVHRTVTRARYSATTIAHERDSTAYLHGMAETMLEHLPAPIRADVPKQRGERGRVIEFANGSILRTETAGDREAGRGKASRAIHASEVAFWPDAQRTMTAIRQIVPRAVGTMVVLESTANGIGNYFHTEWTRAVDNDSDYEAIFAPWFALDWRMPVPDGGLELDEEEQRLVQRYGLDLEQLAWRRAVLNDECGGDIDVFHQEYPSNPREAFLVSGRPYFGNTDHLEPQTPRFVGDIDGDPARGGNRLKFQHDPRGTLKVWELPDKNKRYAIFGDPAGQITEDRAATFGAAKKHDASDYCCAQVIDLTSGAQVAEYHARRDADVFGRDLARLGYLYHGDQPGALIAVETTGGWGVAPIAVLRYELTYPNLYRRRQVTKRSVDETELLGWATTDQTRALMLDGLKRLIREHPSHIRSDGLLNEMTTFIVNKRARGEAAGGCHDDRVMAMAGAVELFREYATRPSLSRAKHTPAPPTLANRAPRL